MQLVPSVGYHITSCDLRCPTPSIESLPFPTKKLSVRCSLLHWGPVIWWQVLWLLFDTAIFILLSYLGLDIFWWSHFPFLLPMCQMVMPHLLLCTFSFFLTTPISGLECSVIWSVYIFMSHKIFTSFSITLEVYCHITSLHDLISIGYADPYRYTC